MISSGTPIRMSILSHISEVSVVANREVVEGPSASYRQYRQQDQHETVWNEYRVNLDRTSWKFSCTTSLTIITVTIHLCTET